eukprot:scaffold270_cov121-Isochrysis_galbana.AAC.15
MPSPASRTSRMQLASASSSSAEVASSITAKAGALNRSRANPSRCCSPTDSTSSHGRESGAMPSRPKRPTKRSRPSDDKSASTRASSSKTTPAVARAADSSAFPPNSTATAVPVTGSGEDGPHSRG